MLRKDPFVNKEYYHLYNRGIDKRIIFKNIKDYERLMMLFYIANSNLENPIRLDDVINKQQKNFSEIMVMDKGKPLVSIGAWCLMTNHFHILVKQEIEGGITKFMKKLGTGYSMFFNIKYQRHGALFGGPFKSKLIGVDDNYLRHLFGYIHLNPLDIEFTNWKKYLNKNINRKKEFLKSYRYSSYQDYIGIGRVEKRIINKEAFPGYFEDTQKFQDFVENYFSDNETQGNVGRFT